MKESDIKLDIPERIQNHLEFHAEKDDFATVRQKGTRRWILKHIFYESNKAYFACWLVFSLLSSITLSMSNVYLGKNIDSFNQLVLDWFLLVTFLVLAVSKPMMDLFASWMREVLAQRMERDTRKELYVNLLGKSQSFHDEQRIGDLMARATNDVRQLNFLISPAFTQIFDSISGIIITIVIIAINYPVQLIIFPIIFNILFMFALKDYVKRLGPITKQKEAKFGDLNAVLNESMAGIEIVKGMAAEKRSFKQYRKQTKKYAELGIKEGIIQARYIPSFMVAITIVLCLSQATYLLYIGQFTIGGIIAYCVLINNFFYPTSISVSAWGTYTRAIAGAGRVLEVMNQSSEIGEIPYAIRQEIRGNVEFDNVSFKYPQTEKCVLKNISFKVEEGQTIAIVGTTGSGKTTCTKLISRLYDINEGKILIDGIDIKNYSLQSLRKQIAYIEQDIFLFSRSISENIAFGRETSEEKIIKAAIDAQAHDFIMKMPQGYKTLVGERGVKLSGGERQRIAIARAFLSDPKILVLDDSTSAIDSATEEEIQKAISEVLKGRTTFLITHRLSQIRWANYILVFKQGRIIAQGTHFDLLKTCEEYRKIFLTRFDKTLEQLLGAEA